MKASFCYLSQHLFLISTQLLETFSDEESCSDEGSASIEGDEAVEPDYEPESEEPMDDFQKLEYWAGSMSSITDQGFYLTIFGQHTYAAHTQM